MPSADAIRKCVEGFYREGGVTARLEDAFAPWVLHSRFRLTPQEALAQSSDGNFDGGLDGFVLRPTSDGLHELVLLQAKFSEEPGLVTKGLKDLGRAAQVLESILTGSDSGLREENRVIQSLRRQVRALPEVQQQTLQITLCLTHLLKSQEAWQASPAVAKARKEMLSDLGDGPLAGRIRFMPMGPDELDTADVVPRPSAPALVRVEGTRFTLPDGDQVILGLGYLSDAVNLHVRFGQHLFSKNVRMYMAREAGKERSAASHIRESLEGICKGSIPVEHFALLHNGITLTAPKSRSGDNVNEWVLDPGQQGISVLNGCQTVYTAWAFHTDMSAKSPGGEWEARFNQVRLPVRLLLTRDEDRVRKVTIGANRQTSISPSAFYAHETVQLNLEERFARSKIFYERQEGAWDHLNRAAPERAHEFDNSLTLEDIARSIAVASHTLSLELARSPQRIFDSEDTYHRVFSEKHIASIRLLTFLYNALRATKAALGDLREEVQGLRDMKPAKFVFPVTRLLVAWMARKRPDLVRGYSRFVYHVGTSSDVRREFRLAMRHQHSGIQQLLPEVWLHTDGWHEAIDKDALKLATSKLHLKDVDIFALFETLDDDDDESAG
ncbi:AIPR family protein [Melittangium boletus]|uniref:Abortive infection protein n=1 Tax=Melittangium boletus DSM 14713 TaxID=1294270 RepID=A0A250IJP5_9BACT|nr:AIPR family protein [Melittangium boletus]ATB31488.1 abortive infection protein [Melittangium boletus DSM 14713]